MLISWYRAKKNEFKVKAMFYGAIVGIVENQKSIIEMIQALFTELKDVPVEQLKDELINKVAELVHEENKKADEE